MDIKTNETAALKKKKDHSLLMTVAACVISMLGIVAEKIYSKIETVPYDPSMIVLMSFIASSILFSCALTVMLHKNKALIWIASILAALVVGGAHVALGASASSTLLSLAFIPSSAVVSLCISGACEKTHTTVANAVILAGVFLASILLEHYEMFGEISYRSVDYTKDLLTESFMAVYSMYDYSSLGITQAQLTEVFETAMLMIPAVFCMLATLISYLEVTLVRLLVLDRGICDESIRHWPLKMSRMASFIFIGSFVLMLIASFQENVMFFVVMTNLTLAILPGFFFIGVRTLPAHIKRPGLFGIIFGILLIISCLQNPALILIIISVSGAFDNLFRAFRERLYGEKNDK